MVVPACEKEGRRFASCRARHLFRHNFIVAGIRAAIAFSAFGLIFHFFMNFPFWIQLSDKP